MNTGILQNVSFRTGSMFTGKTTWLLETKNKYYNSKNSVLYRPSIDTRELKTHNGVAYKSKLIEDLSTLGEAFSDKIKAVFIDEIQFLPSILGLDTTIEQLTLIQNIKPVFIAGLDYSYTTTPFPISEWLEKHAGTFIRLKTYCIACGKLNYCYSHRLNDSTDTIQIGNDYEPRCLWGCEHE